jgi:hypothetical protein
MRIMASQVTKKKFSRPEISLTIGSAPPSICKMLSLSPIEERWQEMLQLAACPVRC